MLSLAVFLPIVCGLLLLLLGRSVGHRMRQVLVETVTVVTSLLVLFCLLNRRGTVYTPFYLLPSLPIRFAIDEELKCKETGEEKTILFGLTGTVYFDIVAYQKYNDGEMTDYIPTDEDLKKGFDGVPKFPGNMI